MKRNHRLLRLAMVVLLALTALAGTALADELYSVTYLNPDGTVGGIQYAENGETIAPPGETWSADDSPAVTGHMLVTPAVSDETAKVRLGVMLNDRFCLANTVALSSYRDDGDSYSAIRKTAVTVDFAGKSFNYDTCRWLAGATVDDITHLVSEGYKESYADMDYLNESRNTFLVPSGDEYKFYTVTFVYPGADGSIVADTQAVIRGGAAVPPAVDSAYQSWNWDSTAYSNVTSRRIIHLTQPRTGGYTITWADRDGTVLYTQKNVPYGTVPTYGGPAFSETKDADYVYAFSGWSPAVTAVTGSRTYTATYSTTQRMYTLTIKRVCQYGPTISTQTVLLPNGGTYTVDNEVYIKNYTNYSTGTTEVTIDGADVVVNVWYKERFIPLKVYCMLDGEYVASEDTSTRYLDWFADYQKWGVCNYYDPTGTYRPRWEFKGYYGSFTSDNAWYWMLGETLDTMTRCFGSSFTDYAGTDLTYSEVNAGINDLAEVYYLMDSRAEFYTVTFNYPSDLSDPSSEIISTDIVVRKGTDAVPPVTAEGWGWDSAAYLKVSDTCAVNLVQGTTVAIPEANTGLVYCAADLCGVDDGENYTLEGQYAADAGTHQAVATPAEGCFWTDGSPAPVTISYTIDPAALTLKGVTGTLVYNGEEQTLSGLTAEGLKAEDHQVSGIDWKAAGMNKGSYTGAFSGTCVVTDGSGADVTANYSVSKKYGKLTISAKSVEGAAITLDQTPLYCDGTAKTPAVESVILDGVTLVSGTDYTVSYSDNTEPGTGKAVVSGTGNYDGSVSAEFTILQPKSLSEAEITLEKTEYDWDNTAKEPAVTVVLDGVTLTEDKDYTVAYTDNVAAGTATVAVTGVNAYSGTAQAQFVILPKDLSGAVVTLTSTEYPYIDRPQQPGIYSVVLGGTALNSKDFEVACENNTDVGTATAVIYGVGNYTGSVTVEFEIMSVHSCSEPDTGSAAEWASYESAYVHEGVNHIFLTEDTAASFSVKDGVTLYLDLNGFTLRAQYAFTIHSGGRLVLCDSVGTGKVTHDGNDDGCGIHVLSGGAADMYGGTITGYTTSVSYGYQGGVNIAEGGSFSMYGGAITDCSAHSGSYGGGISCYKGTVGIHGGTISGCTANKGAGVYAHKSDLTITGGTITGNTATRDGGGVYYENDYLSDPYRFTMTGGTVSGNTASYYGGGVNVYYSHFDFSGGRICGNTSNDRGGGIYGYNGRINMSDDALVDENTAVGQGGGMYLNYGSLTMDGGKILNNEAVAKAQNYPGTAGGVYAHESPVYLQGGVIITGNTSDTTNAGVYSAYPAVPMVEGALTGTIDAGARPTGMRQVAAPTANYVLTAEDAAAFVTDSGEKGFLRAWDGLAYVGEETRYALSLTGATLSGESTETSFIAGTQLELCAAVGENQLLVGWNSSDEAKPIEGSAETVSVTMPDADLSVTALILEGVQIEAQPYTGVEICPVIAPVLNGMALEAGTDYTLSWENNIDAGTAFVTIASVNEPAWTTTVEFEILPINITVTGASGSAVYDGQEHGMSGWMAEGLPEGMTLTGIEWSAAAVDAGTYEGAYTGEAVVTDANGADITRNCSIDWVNGCLTIAPAGIEGAEIWLLQERMTYTGLPMIPEMLVYVGDAELVKGADYVVSGENNINVGTAQITIEGVGNYSGEAAAAFEIAACDIAGAELTFDEAEWVYTAEPIEAGFTVSMNGAELIRDVDYEAEYFENTAAGEARLTVAGKGNYTGAISGSFTISPLDISSAEIAAADIPANGAAQTLELGVTVNGAVLTEGVDYTAEYADNEHAGTASVVITGIGSCFGSAAAEFEILPADIAAAEVQLTSVPVYSGEAQTPEFTVILNGWALAEGEHYTVLLENNVNAGEAKLLLSGVGDCAGSKECGFVILPKPIDGALVSAADGVFCGEALNPEAVVMLDGVRLSAEDDFTVAYENNINAGTAKIIVTGVGNYAGSAEGSFVIAPAALDEAMLLVNASGAVFTGEPIEPKVLVRLNGVRLTEEKDYTVSYADNVNAGQAIVTVTGAGNYAGTVEGSFAIAGVPMAGATVEISRETCIYTGKALCPAVIVLLNGKPMAQDADYSVEYSANVDPGTATVVVNGSGNLTGSAMRTFEIIDSSKLLTGVLPAAIRAVEEEAFAAAPFERIVVPDGCETIGARAFAGCAQLTAVSLPESVTAIAADAFEDCEGVCIYASEGSYAQAWAAENGVDFVIG